ncbi:amino acid ABC transporter membrane protein, PAAT family [Fontimonas thermophila]|uniref:Putative glutamine transport system permease protein GlnP n=1 Tax=Fontimonas thermophila TaxID=1076937 RepID=A0A1I2IGY4_9GAMM|nr:amino acid ABC transporter permease [Fontimonas thermophila]SFF40900.1 amino acid ABC transporter membrane protein, PAAT family [Fontimonas thermophila]
MSRTDRLLRAVIWYALYVALLAALAWGIYAAAQRVDYDWNWSRVPQYIVSFDGEEILAPFDGFVALADDGRTIRLSALRTAETAEIHGFDRITVGDGDLVLENDVIAIRSGITPGPLAWGLWLTLKLSAISLVFALIIGVLAGLARVASNPAARALSATYVEIIRGTPLLVQIFIFYFFVGTVLDLSAFTAGVAALAVFTGAYVAEIVRAGIEAVPRGQMEAARSLGLSYAQAMRHVILPQALKKSLPPLAGQFINLIKDSSLVSVMALTDLTKAGREVVSSTFSPFEVWFTVAAMYLLLTGTLSLWVRRLERRLAHG